MIKKFLQRIEALVLTEDMMLIIGTALNLMSFVLNFPFSEKP